MLTPNDGTPPISDSVATIERAIDEQRLADRDSHRLPMRLTALGCATSLACVSENISEGGCFTHLPSDAGLVVGQRCEIEFTPDPSDTAAADLAGEVRYATVIRTGAVIRKGGAMIGTGLRFDQPLFF